MDYNELLHCLQGARTINQQLTEKLEQARKECAVYQGFKSYDKTDLDSNADQSGYVGRPYRLYTMDFVDSSEILRNAIDVLGVYDGIQFLTPESKQSEAVLRLAQVSRGHKFPDKTFTTRRNSKGVIVWRID